MKYNSKGVSQYYYNGFSINVENNKYRIEKTFWVFDTLEQSKAFVDNYLKLQKDKPNTYPLQTK